MVDNIVFPNNQTCFVSRVYHFNVLVYYNINKSLRPWLSVYGLEGFINALLNTNLLTKPVMNTTI
ncbi:hypothetical protein ENHYD8BJ_80280 [Enhydrobacter sp. 8BJ]|nr:hypothetical protein ENHYD8BJ_80280 [Enhydrobacter sp. 8BJ]